MSVRVHMVTYWKGKRRNDGRPWPRFTRYLHDALGWSYDHHFDPKADVNYVLTSTTGWRRWAHPWSHRSGKLACRFGGRPDYGLKARLWDEGMRAVDLRVTEAHQFAHEFAEYGPSAVFPYFAFERDLFTIGARPQNAKPTIGVAGYWAPRGMGVEMAKHLAWYPGARDWRIKAAGTGWPIPHKRYAYDKLPAFYQSLDVYLLARQGRSASTSVWQALACGVPVVVPSGVPAYDELPQTFGIYRYPMGDFDCMVAALRICLDNRGKHNRQALRDATKDMTIEKLCAEHKRVFDEHFA